VEKRLPPQNAPERWSAQDPLTGMLETAALSEAERSAYDRQSLDVALRKA
jgi:hypothetical protein